MQVSLEGAAAALLPTVRRWGASIERGREIKEISVDTCCAFGVRVVSSAGAFDSIVVWAGPTHVDSFAASTLRRRPFFHWTVIHIAKSSGCG